MTIKFAVQENLLSGESLLAKWDQIRAIGYEGIELRGGAGMAARLPELTAAARAGVVMPSICVISDRFIGDFDPIRRQEALSAMKELCDVAGEVGAKGVVTPASFGMHSNRLPPFKAPRSADEDHAILTDMLGTLGTHAAKRGVSVWLEPLNRYEDHMVNTLSQGAHLCRSVGLTSVKLMADLFHMNIEEADIGAAIREAGDLVAHVHLADSHRREPGLGHTDFASAFQALGDIGFDGFAAIECRFEQSDDIALRSAHSALSRALA